MTTSVVARAEAVHLDQQLVERLVLLPGDVRAALWPPTASSSSMKMIAGACFRASANSRRMRAAPSPANISTNEAADWEKKLAPRFLRDGLGQQRLAGAGRAVEEDALRDRGAELLEALGVAQELDDLLQLVLGLLDAGDVVPADRGWRRRLDLLRLGLGHHLQRSPQEERRSGP